MTSERAGIVLCGGRSSRMGRPKAWLPFGPEYLLQRIVRIVRSVVDHVVVVAAPEQGVPPLPSDINVVRDAIEGRGPLQGLATGFAALLADSTAFLCSCDLPFLNAALVEQLFALRGDAWACVPVALGYRQPLTAVYHAAVVPVIADLLRAERLRPAFLFDTVLTRFVTEDELRPADPTLASFRNLNTLADYEAALVEVTDPGEMTPMLRELGRGLLDLIYPAVCPACALPSDSTGPAPFCRNCRQQITADHAPACPRCSSTLGANLRADERGCPRCRHESYAFRESYRLGPYDGLLRELILRGKQPDGEPLMEQVAQVFADALVGRIRPLAVAAVVPVPLHWRRRWRRTFNQSENLASALAERLGVPCRVNWLRRTRATASQQGLSAVQRRENMRGAFTATGVSADATVALVDDVLTTGATAHAAASALRAAGAASVTVVMVARPDLNGRM